MESVALVGGICALIATYLRLVAYEHGDFAWEEPYCLDEEDSTSTSWDQFPLVKSEDVVKPLEKGCESALVQGGHQGVHVHEDF